MITPWNFPLTIASWKIAPALAAGNAVIHKPSELTPLTAIELRRIAEEAGAPESLLTVLVGTGEEVGRRIVEHPGIGKISLHGLDRGRARDRGGGGAATSSGVTLELGGKSPSIVFADADLQAAALGLAGARLRQSGPGLLRALAACSCTSEALPEFMEHLEAMVARAAGRRSARREHADGPADLRPRARARRRVRGQRPRSRCRWAAPGGRGFWFPPTVLHPVGDADRAAREEIFGPVVCVLAFETESEVIERANDTIYGLSGSIWTADGARAMRVARALEIGALAINSSTPRCGSGRRSAASSSPASGASSGRTPPRPTPSSRTSSWRHSRSATLSRGKRLPRRSAS